MWTKITGILAIVGHVAVAGFAAWNGQMTVAGLLQALIGGAVGAGLIKAGDAIHSVQKADLANPDQVLK